MASRFDSLKGSFDRDGYVIVRQLLTPAEFNDLRANLDRYITKVVPTLPDKDAFYDDKKRPETLKQMQHMGQDAYFSNYRKQATWIELARALIGEACEAEEPEWFNKPPNTNHVTPPHQDNYYFNLAPPNVITIWMALDKVEDENGCLRYIRGSHKGGVRAHNHSKILGFSQGIPELTAEDRANEVPIHLEPGDIVAHHGNLIHRAEANRSLTRHRRAFAMVIKGVSCRRDEAAFARYTAAVKAQHEAMGLQTH
jgi:phytanoyl-CoA hydroxylase